MVNTEPGKRLGKIYIPKHYSEDQIGAVMKYFLMVPDSMEERRYNFEIIGTSTYFDPLKDMETVPTYDLTIYWENDSKVKNIKMRRVGYLG